MTVEEEEEEDDEEEEEEEELSGLAALIRKLTVRAEQTKAAQPAAHSPPSPSGLTTFDVAGVARLIASGQSTNIIVMAGAGISVSAGIPDFRTPGTGLYDNLARYNLPHPTAVFELDYFRANPWPFYLLAKELYPGRHPPTPTHHFIRLLHDKGLLLRCFTQNIDSLEAAAGLPAERIVAAHGNFDAAHCLAGHEADVADVRRAVDAGTPLQCGVPWCDALVKPDIVFFGENLPARFNQLAAQDFPRCDLLIVAGTSLGVQPFAGLINHPREDTPRLLVNRELVGEMDERTRKIASLVGGGSGFNFGEGNTRDAAYLGDCDAGFEELARLLGWSAELDDLVAAGRAAARS
jgi:NAD-dependent deacetylase sirtuin 2